MDPLDGLAYDLYTPPPQWVVHMFLVMAQSAERALRKITAMADADPKHSWEIEKSLQMGSECYIDAVRYISMLGYILCGKLQPSEFTRDETTCVLQWPDTRMQLTISKKPAASAIEYILSLHIHIAAH
jgi:hypothetical protein